MMSFILLITYFRGFSRVFQIYQMTRSKIFQRDDRVAIKTALLFNMPYNDIQKKLNVTRDQISYARN